jgi:thiamine-monophosphate kinase
LEAEAPRGEFALIERIAATVQTPVRDLRVGIGDDAAVLRARRQSVVTTDMLLEDIHFRLRWTDAYRLGWKAVAVNLSDVAAMGATPTFTFVSLGLPAAIPVSFVDELYRGMRDVCARFGSAIAGGDTNASPNGVVISVTQMGAVKKRRVVLRRGARPGDIVCVTGVLGQAAAGLALLEARGLPEAERSAPGAVAALLQPTPRVPEAHTAARVGGVTAMMDISDGLLGDLGKLSRASGVGARVRESDVPVGEDATLARALAGGEDYELLMTVSPDRVAAVRAAVEATGTPLRPIGEVTAEPDVVLLGPDGKGVPAPEGWDHFRA